MQFGILFLSLAAAWNWRFGTVPNWLMLLFLVAFGGIAWFTQLPLGELWPRMIVASVMLIATMVLFSMEFVGGGAAKLVVLTTLWLPWPLGAIYCGICLSLIAAAELADRRFELTFIDAWARQYATIVGVIGIVFLAAGA